jgi:hypothetical protein
MNCIEQANISNTIRSIHDLNLKTYHMFSILKSVDISSTAFLHGLYYTRISYLVNNVFKSFDIVVNTSYTRYMPWRNKGGDEV